MSIVTLGLAAAAGALSTLSPCVLPLLPIVMLTAASQHRHGPLALALGLMLSFTVLGTAIAWLTLSLGISPDVFRYVGAVALTLLGVVLLTGALRRRMTTALAGVGVAGNTLLERLQPNGLSGQLITGLALGLIWSPCVGPTLGAAITLASQGRELPQVAATMASFGAGAAIPLLVLGVLARGSAGRWRQRLVATGSVGSVVLGALLIVIGAGVLIGADKHLEAWLLDRLPAWLNRLTTRY